MHRRRAWIAALAGASLLLVAAGCGGQAAAPPPSGTPQTAPAAAGKPPAQLKPITIALAADVLPMAPVFVAQAEGYYTQKGYDVKLATLTGTNAVQAVSTGNVPFSTNDSGTLATAASRGNGDVLAVATLVNKVTLNLAVGNAVVKRLHLTPQMPVDQRLKALKGLRLGLVSPSGAVAIFSKYLLQREGMNPKADAKLIVIGAVPLLIAALKNGEIDAFLSSPPGPEEAQLQKAGEVLVQGSAGDIPEWSNMTYESLVTSKTYAKAHPNTVRAIAQATAMGANLIRKDPAKALVAIEKHYSKVPPNVLQVAMQAITPAVPADAMASEQDWSRALTLESKVGLFKGTLSPKEGVLWTNQFVQGVNGAT